MEGTSILMTENNYFCNGYMVTGHDEIGYSVYKMDNEEDQFFTPAKDSEPVFENKSLYWCLVWCINS